MKNFKKTFNIAFVGLLTSASLMACSEKTHVEEKVNVNPDTTSQRAVTPDKDVNVNVKVDSASEPAVVNKETRIINVQPAETKERDVVINNNVTTPNSETSVTTQTKTDLETGNTQTQTTEVNTGSTNY